MTTKTKNLGRIIFMILFSIQFSLLTTSCKYLEGNEVVNNEDVAIIETVTETEVEQTAPQTEEEIKAEEEAVQTQLWMDKIADVDWKYASQNMIMRFNKPVQEGDIIRGELKDGGALHKYERISDGELKLNNGIKFKMKLSEMGDTLFLNNGYSDYILLRN